MSVKRVRAIVTSIVLLGLVTTALFGTGLVPSHGAMVILYPLARRAVTVYVGFNEYEQRSLSSKATLYYPKGHEGEARVVQNLFEEATKLLSEAFNICETESLVVFLHKDRIEFADAVPFARRQYTSSVGVYQLGTIHLLSPRSWLSNYSEEQQLQAFQQKGPVLHELTHWYVDLITRGNCPLWLHEGIAQYTEEKHLGFEWGWDAIEGVDFYSLQVLNSNFADLEQQRLAYYQALSLVQYLVELQGWNDVVQTLRLLGKGHSLDTALSRVYGFSLPMLEKLWLIWYVQ